MTSILYHTLTCTYVHIIDSFAPYNQVSFLKPPSFIAVFCGPTDTPLSEEEQSLLKWKMSTITPNVIKVCIKRVGFKRLKS